MATGPICKEPGRCAGDRRGLFRWLVFCIGQAAPSNTRQRRDSRFAWEGAARLRGAGGSEWMIFRAGGLAGGPRLKDTGAILASRMVSAWSSSALREEGE